MQKDLIYLSKDEYKDFLISFDKLKKQRRIIQSIKDKKTNSSDIDSWHISDFEDIEKLEHLIDLQIKQKKEELSKIRFKIETNTDDEIINDIDNIVEYNTDDVLDNSNYEKKDVRKTLFIVNGITSYFNNKNKNVKIRKIR